MKRALLALLVAAALPAPALAHVPMPSQPVEVRYEHCPYHQDALGCYVVGHGLIYIDPDPWIGQKKFVLAHEYGHAFSEFDMNEEERGRFVNAIGRPAAPWSDAMEERFADTYGACALHDASLAAAWSELRYYRAACRVIWRAA